MMSCTVMVSMIGSLVSSVRVMTCFMVFSVVMMMTRGVIVPFLVGVMPFQRTTLRTPSGLVVHVMGRRCRVVTIGVV